jgi:hypothetical protein
VRTALPPIQGKAVAPDGKAELLPSREVLYPVHSWHGGKRCRSQALAIGAGGQHRRRKIRCAEQGAPHLLQHNALIAKAEPVAAISFGKERLDPRTGSRCVTVFGRLRFTL